MATESKRDKKRRDVLEKLERLHAERLIRRDETFKDSSETLIVLNHTLMKSPSSFPSLQIPMYMLDLERDALGAQVDMHWRYRLRTARKLYEQERSKIEDEYKKGRDAVRQRLLDGVEDRRRKIREEKESLGDVVMESLIESQIRPRPSRYPKPSRRNGTNPSPPLSHSQSHRSTPNPMSLADKVASADSLLAALYNAGGYNNGNGNVGGTRGASGSSGGTGAGGFGNFFADAIISPLPYSLAVMPAPREVEKTGKNARRTAGRGGKAGAGGNANGNGNSNNNGDDYNNGTSEGGIESGSFMGQNRSNGNANDHSGPTVSAAKPSNTTVIRLGPAMTGYAKVQGWTPGKALEDLKSMVLCNEMEREGDLANIRGWGRRARGAGGRSGVAPPA